MEIKSNMPAFINTLSSGLSDIDIDKMTRIQASTLLAVMRIRIHQDGIDSQGYPIGIYSPNYLKYRIEHNRGSDPKVILSLTRSMENSMELYPVEHGTGIGFSTRENWKKSKICEQIYKKRIYAPTIQEREMVIAIGKDYISKLKIL